MRNLCGRIPQGVRGLKYCLIALNPPCLRRIPQGVRGLKWRERLECYSGLGSHPARGAWIEILNFVLSAGQPSRIPQGVRGLKYICSGNCIGHIGRIPQGVRGLK